MHRRAEATYATSGTTMRLAQLSISVVLPNYNHARFLPRSLTCLLRQTRPADEVIVIDDGSTDDSLAVIGEFARREPRVRVLRNEKNSGVVATLNRGLAEARGELVFLASSDDLY